jgi:hypothetical protein
MDTDTGFEASQTIVAGQTGYAVPLIVAVTGHRDLVADEVPLIRAHVREFFRRLRDEFPERGITVMSSLAEGADQLVAEEALTLGISLIAPLPMPRELYLEDFETPLAREKFNTLLSQATEIFELPITAGNTTQTIAEHGPNRNRQYAQLGVFLCAHCHILLALWDGKESEELGGTGQVVRFHHDDVMPGYISRATTSRLVLADDESDLVYHIVCSRDRPDGEPEDGLARLSCLWFTTDDESPRTEEMPRRHRKVLELTSEFSQDANAHEAKIATEAWPLFDDDSAGTLPAGARDIDHVFRTADWLAIYFQKRFLWVLRSTHLLALLMGLMYIAYSDLLPLRVFILAFIVFFVLAAAVHKLGGRLSWHRKYLDYRTLAEGLRVQFYWAVAGVTSGNVSKFSHDNFLQMQDSDLGWIRNVMRVAGLECNVSPNKDPAGLEFSIREWIGDNSSGQLGYYRRKILEKIGRNRRTERFAAAVLWISAVAFALFVFASDDIADRVRDPIVVLMGILLLGVGVRQSYSFSVADFELLKQYEFMLRTFSKAHRRIERSSSDEERRRILRIVGEAALEEHAEWILMHRERSINEGEIWRMTG